MSSFRLQIDGTTFRDNKNREVTLRGINVAADAKFPARPDQPSHVSEDFFKGDDVSFVGRPFPADEAYTHFSRLRRWGYNTIRYIFTWEAIEAAGPGKYDEDWIQHTIKLLRIAKEFGFYIFMDPHQDVWSRFTGGSGAPMWTLYACGLDPHAFNATEAALVQNTYPEPETFPKMIWATNYTRLACQVLFTLFFGGRDFAPKAVIDGKNIQDYLQDHFINACKHLAQRIHEAGDLEGEVVIGWESMNEPHRGLIGVPDLSVIPTEQKLQKGTSPTAWQAILTGSSRAVQVNTWDFGGMGPYKSGTALVDPKGKTAWLPAGHDDTRYGWKRSPEWRLGQCLWAQHGVWDPSKDVLLVKDYFHRHPKTGQEMNYEFFTNTYFMQHYRKYSAAVKSVFAEAIMFCQPPVLEIPPTLKGTKDDDPNMVFAPHYYDGVTLMTKKWNRYWNVDVFGLLRGKYLSPAFAIKIGETAIRNSFKEQLSAIRQEGLDHMGLHPCVFTEIGIPYDMNDKYAYKTGDYTSQSLAMDANHFALEGSKANGFTLWVYVATNNHHWGDNWNGEDLSIFSEDDRPLPLSSASPNDSTTSLDPNSPSYSKSRSSESAPDVSPSSLKDRMSLADSASRTSTTVSSAADRPGFRAAEAYVRPSPIFTHGHLTSYAFDLRKCTFTMSLSAPSPTKEDAPTEIFLPEYHFPKENLQVDVSGGKWVLSTDGTDAGSQQRLRWWHAEGEQSMTVRGSRKRQGAGTGTEVDMEEEEDYFEQCRQWLCAVM